MSISSEEKRWRQQIEKIGGFTAGSEHNYPAILYDFWFDSLLERCLSTIEMDCSIFDEDSRRKAFFQALIYGKGYTAIWYESKYGLVFDNVSFGAELDFFHLPQTMLVANPLLPSGKVLRLNKDCALIKLRPDCTGITGIVAFYADLLGELTSLLKLNIETSKVSRIWTGSTDSARTALKTIADKVKRCEPIIVTENKVTVPIDGQEPFNLYDMPNLQANYIVTQILQDIQSTINAFDSEVGISTSPVEKKERMVVAEVESKSEDSNARNSVWLDTLNKCADIANDMFPDLELTFESNINEAGEDNESKMYDEPLQDT